ncbi:MAG: response regulator [Dissulfurispiraceae bacterium]
MAKSILIIDDDISLRNLLKEIFEHLNYEVYVASNGKEGVESYRRTNTNIVLADIYMPGKDGLETIREIMREFPEAKIIAMSGFYQGNMDFFQAARDLGAVDCVNKPFKPEDIVRIVNSALGGKAYRHSPI